ncbi:MAG: nucleotidyltransferase domain-containing protein [Cardiobacteriaceae bacterium]|nr:nucleotidyltransferase domain-containing protein [Cardiobacteriaceae bacterium]
MPKIQMTNKEHNIVRDILQKYVPDYEVWAFGSRATQTAKPYSDLDLAIISNQPLSLQKMADLNNAFSESDLNWKVDIVDWCNTTNWFRQIISQEKIVFH